MAELTEQEREALRERLESWFGDPAQYFLVRDLTPTVERIVAAREAQVAERIAQAEAEVQRLRSGVDNPGVDMRAEADRWRHAFSREREPITWEGDNA